MGILRTSQQGPLPDKFVDETKKWQLSDQAPEDDDSNSSDSSFSLDSMSERSDLDVEDVERIVRLYYQRERLKWANLSLWEKLQLFKAWYIIALIGDILLIFGCSFMIVAEIFPLASAEGFIGVGTFCIWSSIIKYLSNTSDFYVIIRTFNEALPAILKVVVGVVPFYIGVCFLSISTVWQFKDMFGSWGSGFYTLFSVQAGDALFDTYHTMKEANFWYA